MLSCEKIIDNIFESPLSSSERLLGLAENMYGILHTNNSNNGPKLKQQSFVLTRSNSELYDNRNI